jgi:hypothetical protein
MRRIGTAFVAIVTVAGIAYHFGLRSTPAGLAAGRPRPHISQLSGARLTSLFDGLSASQTGKLQAVVFTQPCPARPGLLARAAARVGLEVTARAETSCIDNKGICVGCPTDLHPGGYVLEYGNCTGVCATGGLAGFTEAFPQSMGGSGYQFTGGTGCAQIEGCPCTLQVCNTCFVDPDFGLGKGRL